MSILTAEEVEDLLTLANGASWRTFARAIEAKVMEKINCLEPVAFESRIYGTLHRSNYGDDGMIPLYALEKK